MKKKLDFTSFSLARLMKILNTDQICSRLVGGCVRDALINKQVHDIDIATTLKPLEVIKLLESNNITALPTGLKYGTVTAIVEKESFEITTLRQDIECDGRWSKVAFTSSFEEDAMRRDFTINALSYSIEEEIIYDYFGGLNDLANRKVVFINDAQKRIEEDYLRILRFFRFSSYYADDFDATALDACNINAHNLARLSRERINAEFDKILLAPKMLQTLSVMQNFILANIFPDLDMALSDLTLASELAKKLQISLTLDQIYSILLYNNHGRPLGGLKFSNASKHQIQDMMSFANQNLNKIDIDFLLKKRWVDNQDIQSILLAALIKNYIDLSKAQEYLEIFTQQPPPVFVIDGKIIKQLGYSGQSIGNVLSYLKKIWINSNFNINKEELLKCLKNY